MKLEVRDLRLIEALSRHGTMTKASQDLHVSQSAMSHQLTELERRMGVRFFQRTPRRMRLTSPGERLLASARVVLPELMAAELALKEGSDDDTGVLRISTECYTCYHWLPRILEVFERRYPRVDVQIAVESTRAPLAALKDGRIDVAIVTSPADLGRFRSHPLFRDEIVVIMNPRNELAGRVWIRPADFAEQHLLTYSLPVEQLGIFRDLLIPAGVTPARVSRLELTEAIVEMVKANRGIAVLARWAAAPYLNAGVLMAVRLGRRGTFRNWIGVTQPSKRCPKYLDAFLEMLAISPPVTPA